MKRRFSRRGRGRRPRVAWATNPWNFLLDVTTVGVKTMTQAALLENADYQPSSLIVSKKAHVRRVIGRFSLSVQTLFNGGTAVHIAPQFHWAVWIMDEDDVTDGDLSTGGAGTLMQAQRILQLGTEGLQLLSPTGPVGTSADMAVWHRKIDFDWKGGATLEPDESVWFGVQCVSPTGDLDAYFSARVQGLSRVLVTLP